MNTTPIYLAAFAILISLISLGWSIHIGRRDRGKLKAISELCKHEKYGTYLKVKAVNHGRRPILLTMLGTDLPDGSSYSTYLENQPIRLGENELFVEDIGFNSFYVVSPDDYEIAINLWFEDTLGRRYKVKIAKKHLKKLFEKDNKKS